MKKSKLTLIGAKIKSNVQAFFGWSLLVAFVGGISVEASAEKPDPAGIVLSLACLIFGVLLILISFRTKKLVSKFCLYVTILSRQSSMSIYELAMTLGENEECVVKSLQAMINRKYFTSAYIDMKQKRLIFPMVEKEEETAREQRDALPHVMVTCSVCGGEARIPVGSHTNCMYCNNFIQG